MRYHTSEKIWKIDIQDERRQWDPLDGSLDGKKGKFRDREENKMFKSAFVKEVGV